MSTPSPDVLHERPGEFLRGGIDAHFFLEFGLRGPVRAGQHVHNRLLAQVLPLGLGVAHGGNVIFITAVVL